MTLRRGPIFACLTTGLAFLCLNVAGAAQTASSAASIAEAAKPDAAAASAGELPEAPLPQQPPAAPPDSKQDAAEDAKSRKQIAEEQIKAQQKQRVLGVVPNFNTSYVYGAASLTSGQKFKLAFRSQVDPVSFGVAGFVALLGQAEGSHYGYGGGIGGYAKRYGQTYTDNFDGQMIGNWLLPSVLHQDPRYFRLGRGPVKRRMLYALGTNVLARHDVSGKWEPNYSNVLGNFISGGISNLYIPKDERGFSSTITGGLVVLAEGGFGSMFQEFWPDISRHFLHKDPTNGQDAINKMKPDPTGGGNPFSNKEAVLRLRAQHPEPEAAPETKPDAKPETKPDAKPDPN